MTDDVVIRAENLGKKYVIGHAVGQEQYVALRDVLSRTARGWARSARSLVSGDGRGGVAGPTEDFWALRNIDFEIKRGDVVGIIGRNGAGKSTLLKVLSRITEPTEGRVSIRGRVASLLEVGTGFHPELTGRENVYLNGAVLGMSRVEIRRKFDEIVAFAEIERFLDTPVKRYSSGMYVRLAFAVAAHLEPEILVVDEVLAVGDAEFQKKCLGKMGEISGEGRTVLFVSHNMNAVARLCRSAILLRAGQPATRYDLVQQAIEEYSRTNDADVSVWRNDGAFNNDTIDVQSMEIRRTDAPTPQTEPGLRVEIKARVLKFHPKLLLALGVYSNDGVLLYVTSQFDTENYADQALQQGNVTLSVDLPVDGLNSGGYTLALTAMLFNEATLFSLDDGPKLNFEIAREIMPSPYWEPRRPGYLALPVAWRIEQGGA